MISNKFDVIVPTVKEYSGISNLFNQSPLLNLLPLNHKTTIQFLIDDLLKKDKIKYINKICIVADQKNIELYTNLFLSLRYSEIVCFTTIPSSRFQGIFPSIQAGLNYLNKNRTKSRAGAITNPFIAVCGDTLIQDDFWSFIFKSAENKMSIKQPFAIFAAADCTSELHEKHTQKEYKFQSQNLQSFFILKNQFVKPNVHKKRFRKIGLNKIIDIIDRPLFPVINCNKYINKKNGLAKFSGVSLMNPRMWEEVDKAKNHVSKYFFVKHFINYLIFPFLSKKVCIDICLANEQKENNTKEDNTFDINFPWEHLNADLLIKNSYLNWYLSNCDPGEEHPNLEGYEIEILVPKEISLKEILNHTNWQKFRNLLDSNKFKKIRWIEKSFDTWISPRATVNGIIIKPITCHPELIDDCATVEGVCVLKKGCSIGKNVLIRNSNLEENVIIEANSIVENSIILSGTRIMPFCNISYSIIGNNVLIGGNVYVSYRKLTNCNIDPKNKNFSSGFNEKYFTEIDIINHKNEFGTIIGDKTKIGAGVIINPGRKIGADCIINPFLSVVKNVPSGTSLSIQNDEAIKEID